MPAQYQTCKGKFQRCSLDTAFYQKVLRTAAAEVWKIGDFGCCEAWMAQQSH
jgi:hypothetical protein